MAVVNTANNTIVANTPIAGGLTGVAASPNGATVYITAQGANSVEVISTATNTVTATISVGATPIAVVFHPNGATAYVANQAANTVSVINTATNSVSATIPVQLRPSALAVNAAGTRLLVANNWSSALSVIDTASNTVVGNITVGNGVSGVAITPNGLFAYATNQISNSVAVISLSSNTLLGTIPVQSYPNSIAIAPNGARAFVTNGNSATLSVLDLASNSVVATLGVGQLPSAVAISPDGTRAQVANAQGYSTSVIDTNNLAVVGTVERIGIYPAGVAIAPPLNTSSGGGGGGGGPIPCNYTLSGSSLDFSYTGGNGLVTVNTAPGAANCNWTATTNASWISFVSGIAGSGNGVTTFSVAANSSTTGRAGTITIAGVTFNITQGQAPLTALAPTADSVSPSSGSAASQRFVTVYSDPAGFANLTNANLLIGGSINNSNSCLVSYFRPNNQIYLLNDAGSVYLGPIAMGAAGTISNSQCTVDGAASSASGSGSSLTVSTAIAFNGSFAGPKNSYAVATNGSGLTSAWQLRGTWSVPSGASPTPSVLYTVTPASDTGSGRVFYSAFADPNGASNIQWTQLLIGSSLQGANSCWVIYNRGANALYLYNDNLGFYGPVTPGTVGTLQNGQCILDAGASYAATSGTILVNVAISFKPSFAGPKTAYMVSINNAGKDTGWQAVGSYNVQF